AKYKPVINQILLRPYIYKEKLPMLELWAKESMTIEACSPLMPVTQRPGEPVDKPDQIFLAWAKAKGTVQVTYV
ncbi:hypothetical protein M413DRAFT_68687, partial [Hebeloma cylindrosporum]